MKNGKRAKHGKWSLVKPTLSIFSCPLNLDFGNFSEYNQVKPII